MQQFLTNLLPGLRDARAPLAAGYLWLLSFWLWFADDLPTKGEPPTSAFLGAILRLGDVLGPVSAALAVSFAAYLLGVVSQTLTEGALQVLTRFGNETSRSRIVLSPLSQAAAKDYSNDKLTDGLHALRSAEKDIAGFTSQYYAVENDWRSGLERGLIEFVKEHMYTSIGRYDYSWGGSIDPTSPKLRALVMGFIEELKLASDSPVGRYEEELSSNPEEQRYLEDDMDAFLRSSNLETRIHEFVKDTDVSDDIEYMASEVLAGIVSEQLIGQLHLVEARLMKENAEQYGRFDRLKSESELRLAVSLPLLALVVVLTLKVSPHFLSAVGLVTLLAISGWVKGREAGDTLIDALQTTDGLVPPSVQRLNLNVERATSISERGHRSDKPQAVEGPT